MSGLQLKLPTTFSDATLPVLYADEVMSAGSLMLIDPTNPFVAWSPGLPADLGAIPNVAAATARVLLGVNSDAEVSLTWNQPAGFSGSAGLVERTARGGLHGIASQVNAVTQTGPSVSGRNNLTSYILNNSTHSYYMSTWQRTTRIATGTADTLVALNGTGQQTNSYLFVLTGSTTDGGQFTERGVDLGRVHSPTVATIDSYFHALGSSGWHSQTVEGSLPGDGTNNAVTGPYAGLQIPFGNASSVNGIGFDGSATANEADLSVSGSSGNTNKIGSHIVYRVYLEDLTVSGRTFEEVEKIDHAAYNREVLSPAGRYFGDTFTDPSTLP